MDYLATQAAILGIAKNLIAQDRLREGAAIEEAQSKERQRPFPFKK